MKITDAKNSEVKLNQVVNGLGRYLFNELDGAYNFSKRSNEFIVNTVILYQIPADILRKYKITDTKYKDVSELDVEISIVCYDTKVRINYLCNDTNIKQLGSQIIDFSKMESQDVRMMYSTAKAKIMRYLTNQIRKAFDGYEVLW